MNLSTIKEVRQELERFIKRLAALEKRAESDSYTFHGCKETGALKRSSMDLSNVLVKLRK